MINIVSAQDRIVPFKYAYGWSGLIEAKVRFLLSLSRQTPGAVISTEFLVNVVPENF